jgi:hypothetical protein
MGGIPQRNIQPSGFPIVAVFLTIGSVQRRTALPPGRGADNGVPRQYDRPGEARAAMGAAIGCVSIPKGAVTATELTGPFGNSVFPQIQFQSLVSRRNGRTGYSV